MIDSLTVGGVAGLSLLAFALRGMIPFTSDQGIISLMALDILERGTHPVFCYGSEYGGTLEAHYLAVAFGFFGASPLVFRIAIGFLTVLIAVATWAIARIAFGRRAGLLAGLYVALGPPYLHFRLLTSDGGYASLTLCSALAILALLVADRRLRAGRPAVLPLAGFGFFVGVAWWILPLAAGLVAACAIAVLLAGRRLPPFGGLAAMALAAAVGAFPWLSHNLRTGWLSLKIPEMGVVTIPELLDNVRGLAQLGWPILLGSWQVWRPGAAPLAAAAIAIAFLGLISGFALHRAVRERPGGTRFALVLFLGMTLVPSALSLLARRSDYVEPRYLLLSYLGLAPLCGMLLDSIWAHTGRRIAFLSLLFVLGPVSHSAAPPLERWDEAEFGIAFVDVVERLRSLGLRRAYASYWVAYRVTFLSQGTIVVSPFGTGSHGAVRARELADAVDRDPDPAFLLYGEDRAYFESYLTARAVPHQATDIGNLRLYRDLPSDLVERMRAVRSIPFSVEPGDIAWGTPAGPVRIPAGASVEWETPFTVRKARLLPPTVHLSYHWERPDGSIVVYDGVRSDLPHRRIEATGQILARTKILANVPPGDYKLRFDLVHEGWFWLTDIGIASPIVDVHVTGGPTATPGPPDPDPKRDNAGGADRHGAGAGSRSMATVDCAHLH